MSAFAWACKVCDRNSSSNPSFRTWLGPLFADNLFGFLYIDIVNGQGLFLFRASCKFIMTIVYCLINWVKVVLINDARLITNNYPVYVKSIARYCVLVQIHCDRGVQFEFAIFEKLCIA